MNFGSDFMQHFFILEYKTLPTLESYHYGIVITETSFSAYFIFFFFFFFLAPSEFKLVEKKSFLLHCIPDR